MLVRAWRAIFFGIGGRPPIVKACGVHVRCDGRFRAHVMGGSRKIARERFIVLQRS